MVKKLAIVALVAAAAIVALRKFDFKFECSRKDKATPEAQLKSLEDRIENLDQQKRQLIHTTAVESTAIKNEREELDQMQARTERLREKIVFLRSEYARGKEFVTVADGKKYTLQQVKDQLDRDFPAYMVAKRELESRQKYLAARDKDLKAAYKQLSEYDNKKRELLARVYDLRAQLREVRAAQTRHTFKFDKSEIAAIEKDLEKVENMVEIEQAENELNARFLPGEIEIEQPKEEKQDVLQKIDAEFGLNVVEKE